MSRGVSEATELDFLTAERIWFETWLQCRITDYFKQEEHTVFPPAPELSHKPTDVYQQKVIDLALTESERLLLMLALVPWLKPDALDLLFTRNKNIDRAFSEFGGVPAKAHGGFQPTVETALFVLAGDNLTQRLAVMALLSPDSPLVKADIIEFSHTDAGEPETTAVLKISTRFIRKFTGFNTSVVTLGGNFPAHKITTSITFDELVVSEQVKDELQILETWVRYHHKRQGDESFSRFVMPGYRSLFWGPPGTGKTLAAVLLGKSLNEDVYRVDLSMVVSKWIGETEKNLSMVFDEGERNGWILFFDEADALFARRSASSSSNDRYSNQQVSYLLQRMETYPGVVILATNLRTNLDDALMRRLQSFIHFAMPDASRREKLWKQMLADYPHDSIDVSEIAEKYELSGGVIANVVQYAILAALREEREEVLPVDIDTGIARELEKEGRTIICM